MPAILFVEEEKENSQGRADEVEAEQPSFEIFSCANPDAALDLLQQGSFQCVVANFGDDAGKCTDFLRTVRDQAPEVLRLALLLPGDDEALLLPEIEAANQTLSHGIPAADLVSALSNALEIAARNVQCQWPIILTPFRPIKLTHLGRQKISSSVCTSVDSSLLPA